MLGAENAQHFRAAISPGSSRGTRESPWVDKQRGGVGWGWEAFSVQGKCPSEQQVNSEVGGGDMRQGSNSIIPHGTEMSENVRIF